MSKKSQQAGVEVVAAGDLDVGGVLKNIKAGQVLNARYVIALKSSKPGESEESWYDMLIKSGALVEQPIQPETKPSVKPVE